MIVLIAGESCYADHAIAEACSRCVPRPVHIVELDFNLDDLCFWLHLLRGDSYGGTAACVIAPRVDVRGGDQTHAVIRGSSEVIGAGRRHGRNHEAADFRQRTISIVSVSVFQERPT